ERFKIAAELSAEAAAGLTLKKFCHGLSNSFLAVSQGHEHPTDLDWFPEHQRWVGSLLEQQFAILGPSLTQPSPQRVRVAAAALALRLARRSGDYLARHAV